MQADQALDPTRSIQIAWKLLKQAPVTVLVGGLLLFFLEGGGSGGANFFYRGHGPRTFGGGMSDLRQVFDELRPMLAILIPIALCIGIAFFVLSSWLEVGFARGIELALRTGRDDVGKLFSGGDRFGAMLLARFLCALIRIAAVLPVVCLFVVPMLLLDLDGPWVSLLLSGGVALLFVVVSVFVAIGLFFVSPIVAFESCTPTDAIARSWKLASGQRLRILWFLLFQFFMSIAGLCLCCVGLFLTSPLAYAMRYEVYLALTKGTEYPQWWIGSGRFPFDDHKPEDYGSPPQPPPMPPPLPPQS